MKTFNLIKEYWSGQLDVHLPELMVLLDLYVSEIDNRLVTVGDACIASMAHHTTAIRCLEHLEDEDLILRYADPIDHRRKLLALTSNSRTSIGDFLDACPGLTLEA